MPRDPEAGERVGVRVDCGDVASPKEWRETSRTGVRTWLECCEDGRSVAAETMLSRVISDSLIALAMGMGGISSFLDRDSPRDSATLSDRLRLL